MQEACASATPFALMVVRAPDGRADNVEQAVAAAIRPFDVLGRLTRNLCGAIVLPCGPRQAAKLAQAIRLASERRGVEVRVGVAVCPADGTNCGELMTVALRRARRR